MPATASVSLHEALPSEPDIARRAAGILRDEIEAGALANIVKAERVWTAARPHRLGIEAIRQVKSEVEQLVEVVLDLLVPRNPADVVLCPDASMARGQQASVVTRLANDSVEPTTVRLRCTDLIADTGRRIDARCVRISPEPVHLVPGEVRQVELRLHIPADVAPGLYRGVVQVEQRPDLHALLIVPVV